MASGYTEASIKTLSSTEHIRLRPGMMPGEEEIREFCRNRIAHYKVPRYVRFVESFPLTYPHHRTRHGLLSSNVHPGTKNCIAIASSRAPSPCALYN